ncbi:MAG: hypothetical protein GEU78_12030 [Actinobacteria bacterium]|nr:hypothetical protein [Actinomycetota bacterium]
MNDAWVTTLAITLVVNAVIGFAYPVYRLSRGGPMGDVTGRAILGILLLAIAGFLSGDNDWPRWAALVYGAFFAAIVMPIWILAVLIPMRPTAIDYAYTTAYWLTLLLIALAALLA